jgi:hypothetical protein
MNLFEGMTTGQIISVFVVIVLFSAAAGLIMLAMGVFAVRGGLLGSKGTRHLAPATDPELLAYLTAAALGFGSIVIMVFLGLILGFGDLAENALDNPLLFLPAATGPILLGGVFLLLGAGRAYQTIRSGRRPA